MPREALTDEKIDALWREATDIHGLTTRDRARWFARQVAAFTSGPAPEAVAWWLQGTEVVEFNQADYHDGPEWTPLCAEYEFDQQARRMQLSPDELADKCEVWLQSGGASNVVDAFEAGYRMCGGDRAVGSAAPEQSHEKAPA